MKLRAIGLLSVVVAQLAIQSCTDSSRVCETPPGSSEEVCYEVGDFGKNTLAQETPVPAGDECAAGGKRLDSGFDDNDNGRLDANEVDTSIYICDGATGVGLNALMAVTREASSSTCPMGGIRLAFGVDENADGELAESEVDGTQYVCDGAPGSNGEAGVGATGPAGPAGEAGPSGADGRNTLATVTSIDPSPQCPAGGVRISAGLDLDGDDVLDQDEITQAADSCAPCEADLDEDPNNCGACGNVCGTGNVCADGACTACGGEGQVCCTDSSCDEGLSCDGTTCAPCDVACASGDSVACGAALNEALGDGGTIRVCPGEYEGPFPLTANVEIVGSGSGNNPAVDTILLGADGLGSVVPVTSAITAVLDSLRITGGNGASANSGGVYVSNAGADVTINGCALVGNTGNYGGGASVYSGELTITGSEISGNTAANGGGIATATQSTINSTSITGNTASVNGGGVFVNSGTATLGADVTIAENTANSGGGIYKHTAGATINNSASITNNAPDNCAGNGYTCP